MINNYMNENEVPAIPQLTEVELEELKAELSRINIKDTNTKTNYEALQCLISEYLDSFILLGFTLDGEEVVTTKCDSFRDSRALNDLMNDFNEGMIIDSSGFPREKQYEEDDDEDYEEEY